MQQYLDLLRDIMENGSDSPDRTGTGTRKVIGRQMRYDLTKGFPLLTTKKMSLKNIFTELMWFLAGDTRISTLVRQGNNIWNADWKRIHRGKDFGEDLDTILANMRAGKEYPAEIDNLPEIYGKQWRDWDGEDQVKNLVDGLIADPYGRRHIISAWNVPKIKSMALPPCHVLSQFIVADGKLSCVMYQRSADVMLGVGYNIASYALLLMLVARHVGLVPHELIHTTGDTHIYNSHKDAVKEQLTRTPRSLPVLILNSYKKDIFSWEWADLLLSGYNPYPSIKAKLEVG